MTHLKAPTDLIAPIAEKRPTTRQYHGDVLHDDYFWLKDQGYPEVTDVTILDYLKAENSYFDSVMQDQKDLTEQLFQELKGRIKEEESGVPYIKGDWEYRWAFEAGANYRLWSRRPAGSDEAFQVYFNEVEEAKGTEFFKLHDLAISPCGTLLAWSADTNGSERFTIYVRNLITGEDLSDTISDTSGEIVWNADSTGFAYVTVSKEWRPYLVHFHRLGATEDTSIFEEKDNSFFVHIAATSSDEWLVIRSADHVTAENHVVPLSDLMTQPRCLLARSTGHDYAVDHGWGDTAAKDALPLFVIRSNRDHSNFDLFTAAVDDDGAAPDWSLLLQGDSARYIRGFQVFKDFIAVQQRLDGLDQIIILDNSGASHTIAFPETVCACSLATNLTFDTAVLRLSYTSMITPATVFDYDTGTRRLKTLKVQDIPSGYDKANYRTTRLMMTARDGAIVPVSIVHHKNWLQGTAAPLHLYGYGAYGMGMSAGFSTARLSLLDRGFAYAIAHIRGGDEKGYDWYTEGKLDKRENSFNDFVDCARGLIGAGYARHGNITISGGSAGGELMGAVLNQAPQLFAGCVLHVPFVDVLNTMLDDSLPLTPIEWPEWGNPLASADDYALIKGYCPYTNIEAQDYPPQLVTGGLNDPRVTYWEPAKWTAKMRALKTDDNLLCMKINMGAGHGGKSGRFDQLYEVAEEYTFLLMCTGKA